MSELMCRICHEEVLNEHEHIERHLVNGDFASRISPSGLALLSKKQLRDFIEALVCDYIFVG